VDSLPLQDGLQSGLAEEVSPAAPVERAGISPGDLRELWTQAQAENYELSETEFALALETAGAKYNFGLPSQQTSTPSQRLAFYRNLHLKELALAHACALGREAAWQELVLQYQAALKQAAIRITGSASLGEDLAGALYSELFGLTESDGVRRSPLASYTGRGSLMGWLQATLTQRHVDHHRRTHREIPLEDNDFAAAPVSPAPATPEIERLKDAIGNTFNTLPAEDRFLLVSYFLDGRTLLELARLLRVHEATMSRRLKRLTQDLRKRLLKDLQAHGMSRAAAEEALGTDPRDIDINLRSLLQASPSSPFPQQAGTR